MLQQNLAIKFKFVFTKYFIQHNANLSLARYLLAGHWYMGTKNKYQILRHHAALEGSIHYEDQ